MRAGSTNPSGTPSGIASPATVALVTQKLSLPLASTTPFPLLSQGAFVGYAPGPRAFTTSGPGAHTAGGVVWLYTTWLGLVNRSWFLLGLAIRYCCVRPAWKASGDRAAISSTMRLMRRSV